MAFDNDRLSRLSLLTSAEVWELLFNLAALICTLIGVPGVGLSCLVQRLTILAFSVVYLDWA